jgi:hypothetical protein
VTAVTLTCLPTRYSHVFLFSVKNLSSSVFVLSASVFVAAFLIHFVGVGKGTQPFTIQEWMWAVQGNYLDTMLAHYIRNGGL